MKDNTELKKPIKDGIENSIQVTCPINFRRRPWLDILNHIDERRTSLKELEITRFPVKI